MRGVLLLAALQAAAVSAYAVARLREESEPSRKLSENAIASLIDRLDDGNYGVPLQPPSPSVPPSPPAPPSLPPGPVAGYATGRQVASRHDISFLPHEFGRALLVFVLAVSFLVFMQLICFRLKSTRESRFHFVLDFEKRFEKQQITEFRERAERQEWLEDLAVADSVAKMMIRHAEERQFDREREAEEVAAKVRAAERREAARMAREAQLKAQAAPPKKRKTKVTYVEQDRAEMRRHSGTRRPSLDLASFRRSSLDGAAPPPAAAPAQLEDGPPPTLHLPSLSSGCDSFDQDYMDDIGVMIHVEAPRKRCQLRLSSAGSSRGSSRRLSGAGSSSVDAAGSIGSVDARGSADLDGARRPPPPRLDDGHTCEGDRVSLTNAQRSRIKAAVRIVGKVKGFRREESTEAQLSVDRRAIREKRGRSWGKGIRRMTLAARVARANRTPSPPETPRHARLSVREIYKAYEKQLRPRSSVSPAASKHSRKRPSEDRRASKAIDDLLDQLNRPNSRRQYGAQADEA